MAKTEKMVWDMPSASLQGVTSEGRLIRVTHSMMKSAPELYQATEQDIENPEYWVRWIDKTPHVWYADDPKETLDELAFHGANERHPGIRRVYGPYRVKNIGVDGDVWEVVEMVDNSSNRWQELRPRKIYRNNRQPAYGKCLRLNRAWQEEHQFDENWPELLEYWKEATN